jgi:SAM-dependent methyltransferase
MPCSVCGGAEFRFSAALWPDLINGWRLSPEEVGYINRQQGGRCAGCGNNLRSIALAKAILAACGADLDFNEFVAERHLRVLELNKAGTLHPWLARISGHVLGAYPEIDMHALPFPAGAFDLVVHSDTLEHITNPIHALAECRRVLGPGGALCYTVPIIVGRMSADCTGVRPTYHGAPNATPEDYRVITEFGADAWTYPMKAGFSRVEIVSLEYPSALAIIARA